MNISLTHLTKDQTNVIKGFGILLIVFHNFLHWTNSIGENEFSFDPNRIHSVFTSIGDNPGMILNSLFTYFGHYGVQLFIFISGFGLTKQYSKNPSISYKNYIVPKLLKIYSLVIMGLFCFYLLYFYNFKFIELLAWSGSVLSMINNFSYDWIGSHVGPWWYFSLAVQLYLLFPFLYKIISKYGEKGFFIFLLITYLSIYLLFPVTEHYKIPLYGNFIGHLPEFILGIGIALFPSFKLNLKIIILVLILFILSNFSKYFFPFSFLTITILLLIICNYLFKLSDFFKNKLIYLGSISMFIFIINGPLRSYTMRYLSFEDYPLLTFGGSIIHFFIVLFISIGMSYIYKWCFTPVLNFLLKKFI